MNIPKEIIEKSIEGGWSGPSKWVMDTPMIIEKLKVFGSMTHDENCTIALDPTFWQALGKALGWNSTDFGNYEAPDWLLYAHRFYDLILQGKDTTNFWKEILN